MKYSETPKKSIIVNITSEAERNRINKLLGDNYIIIEANDNKDALSALLNAKNGDSIPIDKTIDSILPEDATKANEQIKELREKVIYYQEHDELTGLYNSTGFYSYARRQLDDNPGTKFVLVRMDIDRFKAYNDTFGKIEGDKLLSTIGKMLLIAQNKNCVFGRLNSDHFVALVKKKAFHCDKWVEKVSADLAQYQTNFHLSTSIGIYEITDRNLDISLMCDRALLALQTVKSSYFNKYAYYDDNLRRRLLLEQELTGEMDLALKSGQFIIYFQPQYNYYTNSIFGAEALVRWNHPVRGVISPGDFIPLFEKNGFITKLDEYVWEQSCKYIRKWLNDKSMPKITVSVNLSRLDIYNPKVCDILTGLVKKYKIPTSSLKLEITESVYVADSVQLVNVGKQLKKAGFIVQMDDFGSGYSSLNMLKDVPVDTIKLDMDFLRSSDDDKKSGNIVTSVVRMAHNINIPVIAEGVETTEQAEFLKSIGCYYMQGYVFARPMPADEFENLLRNSDVQCHESTRFINGVDGAVDFLDATTQSTLLFNSFVGGAGIIEFSGDEVCALRLNDKWFDVLGVSRDDYSDSFSLDRYYPDSRKAFIEMLYDAISTGNEASCETCSRPLNAGSSPIWIQNRVRCLVKKCDSYLFYLSIENITGQKALMAHNAELNKKLSALIANTPGGITSYRLENGRYMVDFISESFCNILNYTHNELFDILSRDINALVHQDDLPSLLIAQREVIRYGSPYHSQYRLRRKDGDYIWVTMYGNFVGITAASGMFFCSYTDITPLKVAQEDLAREKSTMENIINAIPGGVATYEFRDGKSYLLFASDGVSQLSGLTPAEFAESVENGDYRVYKPDEEKLSAELIESINTGKEIDTTYRMVHVNGQLVWVNLRGRITGEHNGNPVFQAIYFNRSATLELYQDVIDLSDSGILVADKKTHEILFINNTAIKIFGKTQGTVCGAKNLQCTTKCNDCLIYKLLECENNTELELNGRRYINRTSFTVWNGHEAFVNYLIDCTDAWQARQRLDKVIHNIPAGLAEFTITSGDILCTYLSEGAYQILGYSSEDPPYLNIAPNMNRIHPEDITRVREGIYISMTDHLQFNVDFRVIPKSAEMRWVNLTANFTFGDDNELKFYGIFSDVSERFKESNSSNIINSFSTDEPTELLLRSWLEYLRHTDNFMFVKDINHKYLAASNAFVKMTGANNVESIIGKNDFDVFADKQLAQRYISDDLKLLDNGIPLENFVEPIASHDGKPKYSSTSKYAIKNDRGTIIGLIGIGKDVSEKHQTDEYRLVMEQTGRKFCRYIISDRMVYSIDSDDGPVITAFKNKVRDMEFIENDIISSESFAMWNNLFEAIERGDKTGSADIELRNKYCEFRWYNIRFTGIVGADGKPASAIISYEDITEDRELVNSIRHQAETDGMTKLMNHSTIERRIKEYLSQDTGNSCAFVFLDIDNFKSINDTYGHMHGDKSICAFANAIKTHFGEQCFIGRLGGDEFAVFIPDVTDKSDVELQLIEFMRKRDESCNDINDVYSVSCSAGVAFGVAGTDKYEILFSHADLALYKIKHTEKNKFLIYDESIESL